MDWSGATPAGRAGRSLSATPPYTPPGPQSVRRRGPFKATLTCQTRDTRSLLRLVTIPISHYCEKARWALDRAGLPYREEPHVQGVHQLAARRAGGGITVPVLVTPDGAIGESAEILAWVDRRLPPERRLFPAAAAGRAQIEGLCRRLDDILGPAGRRLLYVHMFPARELALRVNNQGVPAWEDRAIRAGWPLAQRFVRRVLRIAPGVEVEDEAVVWGELDFVAGLLADGRPYLCGERLGAADLTFAALAAPLVVPPGYGVPLPPVDLLPPALATLVGRVREHPAGRHALMLFAQHRRERAA
ncbi:MAG TPA: glutathione S-transferase family protein [Solirubrobacteraceae bacterium]|nr:glutathione S-transferase family protein [Solirubrobacteraceae bacterium]